MFPILVFWVESTWRSGGLSIRVHVQTFDVPIATERRGGYTICRLSAISHYNDSIWRYCVVLVAKYRLFQEWRTPNQWPIEFVHPSVVPSIFLFLFFLLSRWERTRRLTMKQSIGSMWIISNIYIGLSFFPSIGKPSPGSDCPPNNSFVFLFLHWLPMSFFFVFVFVFVFVCLGRRSVTILRSISWPTRCALESCLAPWTPI